MMLLVIAVGFIVGVNIFVFTLYLKGYKTELQEVNSKMDDTRSKSNRSNKQISELEEKVDYACEEIKVIYNIINDGSGAAGGKKTGNGSRGDNSNRNNRNNTR